MTNSDHPGLRAARRAALVLLTATTLIGVMAASGSAAGGDTTRVSVDSSGTQGNDYSHEPSVSADGRYVAFESAASNLVSGDTNGQPDVFVRDLQGGTTQRASVNSSGTQGNNVSGVPSISSDGGFVAFESGATNLVANDANGGTSDVFVRSLQGGTNEIVSVDSSGTQGNSHSFNASISTGGRYVVFQSYATNLVPGNATDVRLDVFWHDRESGTTVQVSTSGILENSHSYSPTVSSDGRYVAFYSEASDLVANDTNANPDVFVRDLQGGTTRRVSVGGSETQANAGSYNPSISADGRHVVFQSNANNLVANDTNTSVDVFVRDLQDGTTERASVSGDGVQGNALSQDPSISPDGRFVAFSSTSSNLVADDVAWPEGKRDVFVRDLQGGTTERASVDGSGNGGNGDSWDSSISSGGRFVAFESYATNLVAGDTNGHFDVFAHQRNLAPVANDDRYRVKQRKTLNVGSPGVLANDTDPDGDQLTPTVVTGPRRGALTLRPDGSLTYKPRKSFSGRDSFVYEVGDGNGGADQAKVNITVKRGRR